MTDEALDWLAMQYVLGELTEQDRSAFEERMANDVTACEAVAAATRLCLAVNDLVADSSTSVVVQPIQSPRRRPFAIGATIASFACLLALALYIPNNKVAPVVIHSDSAEVVNGNSLEIVSLWRQGMTTAEPSQLDTEEQQDEVTGDEFVIASEETIPSWLLAGVALESIAVSDGPAEQFKEN